jgi:Tol biopolymer transport system component
VPGDANGAYDVFVYDRQRDTTERVSVRTDGRQVQVDSVFPSVSGDGRYVAFISRAPHLVPNDTNQRTDVFVHDRITGATKRVSVATGGAEANGRSGAYASISEDVAPVPLSARELQGRKLRRVQLMQTHDGAPERAAASR